MTQRKNRQSTQAKSKCERRRANKHIFGANRKHLSGIAIGYGQKITVKVHGGLWSAGRTRSECQQGNVISPSNDGIVLCRLIEREPIEFRIMIGSTVKANHLFQPTAAFGTGDQFIHHPGIAKRQAYLGHIHNLPQFNGT